MEPAPVKNSIFNNYFMNINSPSWVEWLTKLANDAALSPPGNTTLFYRGDGTWQIPGGFVPGAHANSHVANGSDPLANISQSQITNLVTDLANKADKSTSINTANGLTGGGNLSANRTLTPVYGSAINTICQGNDNRLVTNGNNHTHSNGDGGTIDHVNLSNIGNNTHAQIDTHISNANIHFLSNTIDHGGLVGLQDQDHSANAIYTDTANFSNNLTANDTSVQLALDTLDDLNIPIPEFGNGTPSSTPGITGAIYVDQTNDNYYMANSNTDANSWRLLLSGEVGVSNAFNIAASGSDTYTYTFNQVYVASPKVFLTYDNSVSNLYSENFQAYANGANMESYDWTHYNFTGSTSTFLANAGANSAMYGECKVTSGAWVGSFLYTGTGAANWSDYELNFDVVSYGSGRFIIQVRADANNGAFTYQCIPGSANESKVFHSTSLDYPANSTEVDVQTAPANITACKIIANSTNIKIYLNGNSTALHDITNSNHATGSIGIGGYSSGWQIDNIVVRNIAGTNNVVHYIDSLSNSNVTVGLINNDANQVASGKLNIMIVNP